jgi:hypothetical protein
MLHCDGCGEDVGADELVPCTEPDGPRAHQRRGELCGPVSPLQADDETPDGLPTLDAKNLKVIHLTLCGVVLHALVASAVIMLHQDVNLETDEAFLRRITVRLVHGAKAVWNQPYPSKQDRFEAITVFCQESIRITARSMMKGAVVAPTRSILGPDGKPVAH